MGNGTSGSSSRATTATNVMIRASNADNAEVIPSRGEESERIQETENGLTHNSDPGGSTAQSSPRDRVSMGGSRVVGGSHITAQENRQQSLQEIAVRANDSTTSTTVPLVPSRGGTSGTLVDRCISHTSLPNQTSLLKESKVTSDEHLSLIEKCFDLLTSELGVYFEMSEIISSAIIVTTEPSTVVYYADSSPSGVYIVLEGVFSFSSHGDDGSGPPLVLGQMSCGEMFGEVATLMNVPNIGTVTSETSGKLIKIPCKIVNSCVSGKILKTKARSWCVRRAHLYTSRLFEHSIMALLITISAIKSTKEFSDWSNESLEYMSRLCQMTLFSKGEPLQEPGDPSSHLYIIIRGSITCNAGPKQQTITVRDVTESCCVGVEEFFKKLTVKQTVIASSPVLVVPLGREALLATVEEFSNEKENLHKLLNS